MWRNGVKWLNGSSIVVSAENGWRPAHAPVCGKSIYHQYVNDLNDVNG